MGAALSTLVPTTAEVSWLLAASAKAALLLAAAWLGALLLRRGTAAARHQLWALGVAGALLLPLLAWLLPSLSLSLSLPVSLPLAPATVGDGPALVATAVSVTGTGAAGAATAAGPAAPAWPAWIVLTWAAGTLLVSLRFLRGHLAARRLSRTATPAQDPTWLTARRQAAAALGFTRDVGLGRSEHIGSPMTIGVRRPQVLLPAAADAWTPERLHAVLMHELGHVRRRDTLVQLGAQLLCALHWWNPLAWQAAARLRVEREHACDDLVLDAGIRPSSYAADLLDVARLVSPGASAHAGGLRMVEPSGTEARLRRILDAAAPRRPPGARFRLAARGATVVFATALACTTAPQALPLASTAAPAPKSTATPRVGTRGTLAIGTPSMIVGTGAPEDGQPQTLAAPLAPYLSQVALEVERRAGELERCYQRRLVERPELAGSVAIHWYISPEGEVLDACITNDSVGDAEITACVNALVNGGRYPAHDGPAVDVTFPFTFTAVAQK